MALRCAVPRLEAALAEGALVLACSCGVAVHYPGWWCEDCCCCAHPNLVRDCDDEPDNDYS
jgi:hypothetical protein